MNLRLRGRDATRWVRRGISVTLASSRLNPESFLSGRSVGHVGCKAGGGVVQGVLYNKAAVGPGDGRLRETIKLLFLRSVDSYCKNRSLH